MSKSLGNVVNPQDIIGQHGADVLRLWVASTDYRNDVRISDTILNNLIESYRRIRNTIRFMLGNLFDFDPKEDSVSARDMEEIDRWILSRLQRVIDRVTRVLRITSFTCRPSQYISSASTTFRPSTWT